MLFAHTVQFVCGHVCKLATGSPRRSHTHTPAHCHSRISHPHIDTQSTHVHSLAQIVPTMSAPMQCFHSRALKSSHGPSPARVHGLTFSPVHPHTVPCSRAPTDPLMVVRARSIEPFFWRVNLYYGPEFFCSRCL